MTAEVLFIEWVLPGILVLTCFTTIFYPLFSQKSKAFGEAQVGMTINHIAAGLILIAVTGGIIKGVIEWDSLKNALSDASVKNEELVAENEKFKMGGTSLAAFMTELYPTRECDLANNFVNLLEEKTLLSKAALRNVTAQVEDLSMKTPEKYEGLMIKINTADTKLDEMIIELEKQKGAIAGDIKKSNSG